MISTKNKDNRISYDQWDQYFNNALPVGKFMEVKNRSYFAKDPKTGGFFNMSHSMLWKFPREAEKYFGKEVQICRVEPKITIDKKIYPMYFVRLMGGIESEYPFSEDMLSKPIPF